MPATRSPARNARTSYQSKANIGQKGSEAQTERAHISANLDPVSYPLPKKRRAPNAFILFRSFMIASRLIPPELTHQNDVSRYVAENWRAMSPSDRSYFFRMAKDRKMSLEAEPTSATTNGTTTGRHRTSMPREAAGQSTSSYTFTSAEYGQRAPNPAAFITNAGYLGSPAAPQPIRAIPPDLLRWGDDHPIDPPTPNMQEEYGTGSPPAYARWPSEYGFNIGFSSYDNNAIQPDFAATSSTEEMWQTYLGLDPSSYEYLFDPNSFSFYA